MPQKNTRILQAISKRFIEKMDDIISQPKIYEVKSVKDFSKICNISENGIYKIRNGHTNVTLEHIYHLCNHFNISSNDIIFETQIKERKTIEQRLHTLESLLLRDS